MMPIIAAATKGDTLKKAGIVIGGIAVLGLSYWAYTKYVKKANIKQAASKYGDGSKEGQAVEYAGVIYSALHSGWFNMTEDEKAIYSTALEMNKSGVSMKMVGDAYRKLYQKELVVELNRLLDPDELAVFNNALNGNYKPVSSSTSSVLKTGSKIAFPILNLIPNY